MQKLAINAKTIALKMTGPPLSSWGLVTDSTTRGTSEFAGFGAPMCTPQRSLSGLGSLHRNPSPAGGAPPRGEPEIPLRSGRDGLGISPALGRQQHRVGLLDLRKVSGVGDDLEASPRDRARVGPPVLGSRDPVAVAPEHERRNLQSSTTDRALGLTPLASGPGLVTELDDFSGVPKHGRGAPAISGLVGSRKAASASRTRCSP